METAMSSEPADTKETTTIEPIGEEITIDTFIRSDLRVGVVREAKPVEGANKLLELSVDVGEGRHRTIFAGLATAYAPGQLEGRRVVVVANLKPRKMRFGVSEGMVLAAGTGGQDLQLVEVGEGAEPGSKVS